MYSGKIILPENIQARCTSLINIGGLLQIYSICEFVHVMDVHSRIMSNECTIMDLAEVIQLCDILIEHPCVDDNISNNIVEFKNIIQLFITVASQPVRPCGMWNNVVLDIDEDQYL